MKSVKQLLTMSAIALASIAAAQGANAASVEPQTQSFLDALVAAKVPAPNTLTPVQARELLAGAQSGKVAKPAADIEDRVIPVGPTGSTRIRIIRPQGAHGVLPVVMYFHGAGWVMGDVNTHDRLVRQLAEGARAAVVFVDYERSPEARYPVAIEQDYAATKYVAEHAAELNVDASRLAVAGDSVGGNMAAVVSLMAKERQGPAIKFQLLFYPVTDTNFDNGSYNEFANGPWLTKDAMKWFWNAYLPVGTNRKDIHIAPLQATLEQLKDLPAALVITDENDVLRDEGEAYAAKLAKAGVPVTQVRYLGTIHDFVMLNGLADTSAAKAAVKQASASLRKALAK